MKRLQILLMGLIGMGLNAQALYEVTTTNLPDIVLKPYNSMDANVADIDADGDLDIVLAVEFHKNVILLNDGSGNFQNASHLLPDKVAKEGSKPYPYYPYHDSEDVIVEDINKDGLLDILFVTEDDKTNELYFQESGNVFKDASHQFPVSNISNALNKGDFDGDGWVDFILGNKGQNNYLQNNKGTLIDDTANRMPKILDVTQDIEIGDYDVDGDLDILVGNEDENRLLINDGKGFFTDITEDIFTNGNSEETRESEFVDIDNDGDLDIYFANVMMFTKKSPIQRLLLNDGGVFIDQSDERLKFNGMSGALDADFFDIDQDGDQDLLVGKLDGLAIAINNGKGFFQEKTDDLIDIPVNAIIVDIEVADFNKDGKPDIYLACFRGPDKLFLGK